MSLKRECDRCHHLTGVDSLNARDMRIVEVQRGGTTSPEYDLCRLCLIELDEWMKHAPTRTTDPQIPIPTAATSAGATK